MGSAENCHAKETSMPVSFRQTRDRSLISHEPNVLSSQENQCLSSGAKVGLKPPVLLVGNFLSSFVIGERHVCEDLAAHLAASHWTVLTTSEKTGRIARLIDMLRTVWSRRKEYTVAQVDVYSGNAFVWAEAVCKILSWIRKPYILTLHGGNLPAFSRRWPQRVCRLLRSADAVTTPSRYLLESMAHYRPDLRLLHNPLDLSSHRFRLRDRPQPRLVWIRAFHHIYNPMLAVRVLALLAADFPDFELIMVGPDKRDGSLQALQKLARELGLSDRIVLKSGVPRDEVPQWLNKADIFLNTTHTDNAPVSVLEAMACGLCVVSTNVGGIPYLLEDEQDAILVLPNNPEAMANAVRRILAEPGLATHLSKNARQKAEQFAWSNILPKWELLLTLAVNGIAD